MSRDFQSRVDEVMERIVPGCREQARGDLDMLLNAGVRSEDDLFHIVEDPSTDPALGAAALWLMTRLGLEGLTPSLFRALSQPDPGLRATAAMSIGEAGIGESTDRLVDALRNDVDREVRKAAAYALGLVGDPSAVGALLETLEDASEHPETRGMAAEALASIGDPSAVAPLVEALGDPAVEVRFWAAFALGELADEAAIPALRGAAEVDRDSVCAQGSVGSEAEDAVRRIRERRAESFSRERLGDRGEEDGLAGD